MLASLRQTPPTAPDFRRLVLTNLAAWEPQQHSLELLIEHPRPVIGLAFSPDSRSVLTTCTDGTLRRWDLAGGQLLGPPFQHPGEVGGVAVSPDGKRILTSCSVDGRYAVYCWDAATGNPLGEPLPHPGIMTSICFSPDGKTVLVGGYASTTEPLEGHEGLIQAWDLGTGQRVGAPVPIEQRVRSMRTASSPDGRRVVVATSAWTSTDPAGWEVREAGNLAKVLIRVPSAGGYWDLAFHPEGKTVLTGDFFEGMARRWDVETGKPIGPPLPHPGPAGATSVSGVRYTPDGRFIVTSSYHAGVVLLWDGQSGELLSSLGRAEAAGASGLVLSPDGRFAGVSSTEPVSEVWRLARAGTRPIRLPEGGRTLGWSTTRPPLPNREQASYRAARLDAEGNTAALVGSGPIAQLIEVATGRPIGPPLYHPWGNVQAVAFSPQARLFATAENPAGQTASTVHIWDADTGLPRTPPLPQTNSVLALAFSPDGNTLAVGDYHAVVSFWDTRTGQPCAKLIHQQDIVLSLAYSPDGRRLVVGVSDDHNHNPGAQVWDVATHLPVGPYLAHKNWVWSTAFSPDGGVLLTGGRGGVLHLWSGSTIEPLGDALTHASAVKAAVFSPDSRRLATGCTDGTVHLWDAGTGRRLPHGVLAHPYALTALAFSPDGKSLLAGCEHGISRLWDLATCKAVEPPLVQRQDILAVAFRPDGRSCVTVPADGDTRVWPVPEPCPESGRGETDPDQLTLRFQVRTGLEMDAGQHPVPLDAGSWQERKDRLARLYGGDVPPLAAPLDDAAWHEAHARDAEADDDDFGALWHLDRLVALRPDDWSLYARRARVHAAAGRLQQAEAEYGRAVPLAPTDALCDWYLACAAVGERREQWSTALWYLDKAIAARPGDWPLYYQRAAVHSRLGKGAAADSDRAEAVERGADGNCLCRMAEDEVQQEHWERAAALYARGRRQGYLPYFLWEPQALLCLKLGDQAAYRDVCTRADQCLPPGVEHRMLEQDLVEMCTFGPAALPDYAHLLDRVRARLDAVPPGQAARRHDLLRFQGALEYRAGHYPEAIAHLREAVAAAGGQGEFHDWIFLAMACQRQGESGEARQWLARALAHPLPAGKGPVWDRLQMELLRREAEALFR